MTFVMVIPRRPISSGAGGKGKFKADIQAEARVRFAGRSMFADALYIRIVWFHSERTSQDIDNIAKRLLDALEGVVYPDDYLIVQCLTVRIDLTADFAVSDQAISPDLYRELLALLGGGEPHILYVEVGPVTARRVAFGPIDGGAS